MERVILHVDCNKFYASVECKFRPSIRNKPVVVGGNEELRHGIVLTKNEIAASYGIQTAEPLWKAREKCPALIVIPPHYPLYQEYSKRANAIYYRYTSQIEPFGLDESWLDVTGSQQLFGSGAEIAERIRQQVKQELGITVSIGVSFNKIFAKLGSDYKKPDAVTVFDRSNYREKVWPLPIEAMLFVGETTRRKLNFYGIETIGDLAGAEPQFLKQIMGKNGELLHIYANGNDTSRVKEYDFSPLPKSIGNSTTTPRDMRNNRDVKRVFLMLGENVARRMRKQGVKGNTITIHIKDVDFTSFTRQGQTEEYTNLTQEIVQKAMALFEENYHWAKPLRSIGLAVSHFEEQENQIQMDLEGKQLKRMKAERLEKTLDQLRERFGPACITPAALLEDQRLLANCPHDKPNAYFEPFFR